MPRTPARICCASSSSISTRHRNGALAAASIGSEDGRTVAEGLEFRAADGGRVITLDRLALDNLRERPEGGFAADAARLDGVAIGFETGNFRLPTLEASRLAVPDLFDLSFDPDRPVLFLAKLYAAMAEAEIGRMAAPVLELSQTIEAAGGVEAETSIHYADLLLEDWTGGVIHSFRAGPILIQSRSSEGPTRIEIAGAEARRMDISTLGHVLDPDKYRNGRGDRVWRSAMDSVLYSGIRITDEDDTVVTIAGIGMNSLDLRQPERPFTPVIERAMAQPEMSEEEEEALARELVPALLQSFRIGDFWMEGLQIEATPGDASGGLRRFTMTGLSAERIDRIALEGFNVAAPDAVVSLGVFELAGLVFPEMAAVMRAAELGEAEEDPEAQAELARLAPSLLPKVARLLIERVSVTGDGIGPITLDSYLGEAERFVGPFPREARGTLTGLTIPSSVLKADPEAAGFFAGLDIDSLTIDFAAEGTYEEAEGRARSAIEIAARDLMSLRMEADFLGLTELWLANYSALATGDPSAAMPLLAELQLVGLSIEVDDTAMVERGFAFAAREQGRDAAAYREEIKGALPFLLGFLTDPIFRADVAGALQSFLDGGRALSIRIAPPEPVSVAEILAALDADPQGLPSLLGATVRSGE
jgi:hypothetical protein